MIRNVGIRLRPLLTQGPQAGAVGASDKQAQGPSKTLARPAGMPGPQDRPISTVIQATDSTVDRQGRIQVRDPGHVQFQPSANDLKNNPNLAPALGHAPVKDRSQRENFSVQGQLSDGRPFSVTSARNQSQVAGQDKPIDLRTASHVIDHGDMTLEQSWRYQAVQERRVFPKYETSGLEQTNCVAGHIELTKQIFGQDVGSKAGEGLHPHAMPQDLVGRMEGVRTEPDAPGKPPRS